MEIVLRRCSECQHDLPESAYQHYGKYGNLRLMCRNCASDKRRIARRRRAIERRVEQGLPPGTLHVPAREGYPDLPADTPIRSRGGLVMAYRYDTTYFQEIGRKGGSKPKRRKQV